MTLPLIVRNRATQDLRQHANYILAMGNRNAAERFLSSAELHLRLYVVKQLSQLK